MTGIDIILATVFCLNASSCTLNNSSSSVELAPSVPGTFLPLDTANLTTSLEDKQNSLLLLRNEINGQKLLVATLEDYPLSYTRHVEGKSIGLGVSFDIINFLAEKFNFTYDVVVPGNNTIGSSADIYGSLTEIIQNKTADIAAAFIPHLADLRKYLLYSTTLDEGEWVMIMLRPAESATGSGLLAPFETYVWILIIVSLFAVGPIIYVLIIIRNKLTGDDTQKPYSLSHCAWFVYGALMKQGSTLSPIADSTRLLFATWWIFITILTSFYTANLTAFLTLSKFTLPFNSVDDILRKEKHFVAQRGSGIEYAIRNDGELLNMLNNMVYKNRAIFTTDLNDTDTLINYVEKKNYVFVRDRPAIEHLLYLDYRYRKLISLTDEKIHCPFAVSKIPFMRKKRSFAYPNQSKWVPLFEPEILNLVESGVVKFLMGKNIPNAEICPQDLAGTERQLRNGDLMMTYYIMLAGFATAIVVFCTELVFRFINGRVDSSRYSGGAGTSQPPKSSIEFTKGQKAMVNTSKVFLAKNITPPPAYNSLFYRHSNFVKEFGAVRPGNTNFNLSHGKRKIINGRDYMVYEGNDGEKKLVPMRVPSATLFQYSYTE